MHLATAVKGASEYTTKIDYNTMISLISDLHKSYSTFSEPQ